MESVKYDLIIVGGGIYGMMLAWEAKKRNLHSLILEKDQFGKATSSNSSKIIHGGLRYLQSFDFKRHQESKNERAWFFKTFPTLIKPLPVVFPLYNRGVLRSSFFRAAFFLDKALFSTGGKILSREETVSRFPQVVQDGLKGAAYWEDGTIVDQDRLMAHILEQGGESLDFHTVEKLIISDGRVKGVQANGKSFYSNIVVNATGPWCRAFAKEVDQEISELFQPSLAFNLIFDRKPISKDAIALTTVGGTYFLQSLGDRLYAGTFHAPWSGATEKPTPPQELIDQFISNINQAIPGLNLTTEEIVEIRSGLLPDQATKEVIVDHASKGGPKGFYSVSGVKWTTSRLVAQKTLGLILN